MDGRRGAVILQSLGIRRFLAVAVSGLAAVALLSLAAWLLLGNDSGSRAPAVQIIASPSGATPAPELATTATPAGKAVDASGPAEIVVYVTGEVVNPGVYRLTAGQRLDAAIALAGGPTGQADLSRLNLAAYAADAAHYRVPAAAPESGPGGADAGTAPDAHQPPAPGTATTTAAAPCASPVDINSATADCLETLPGIGRVRAESIVVHREQAGPFATAAGIVAVPGIGDGIYRRIANLITVTPR